jgi:hypothetical protein
MNNNLIQEILRYCETHAITSRDPIRDLSKLLSRRLITRRGAYNGGSFRYTLPKGFIIMQDIEKKFDILRQTLEYCKKNKIIANQIMIKLHKELAAIVNTNWEQLVAELSAYGIITGRELLHVEELICECRHTFYTNQERCYRYLIFKYHTLRLCIAKCTLIEKYFFQAQIFNMYNLDDKFSETTLNCNCFEYLLNFVPNHVGGLSQNLSKILQVQGHSNSKEKHKHNTSKNYTIMRDIKQKYEICKQVIARCNKNGIVINPLVIELHDQLIAIGNTDFERVSRELSAYGAITDRELALVNGLSGRSADNDDGKEELCLRGLIFKYNAIVLYRNKGTIIDQLSFQLQIYDIYHQYDQPTCTLEKLIEQNIIIL